MLPLKEKGAPGMPEMLSPGAALVGAGLGHHVPLVTDGRFSGEIVSGVPFICKAPATAS